MSNIYSWRIVSLVFVGANSATTKTGEPPFAPTAIRGDPLVIPS